MAPYTKAVLSCGAVANRVTPCLGYLRTGGSVPLPCCAGVKVPSQVARPAPRLIPNCLQVIKNWESRINISPKGGTQEQLY
ncbi:hypothetical protein RJ640_013427 [Escallonia rubra]|uniref:Uncharacterized protein n=1 Tax=Escallonia rubra TaxID=112253 RepID=A0AA88U7A7_9ASTE|nr:hypothetical protein RJ640_013427 [Escallonia rubra]